MLASDGRVGATIFPDVWDALRELDWDAQACYVSAVCDRAIDGIDVDPDDLPLNVRVLYLASIDRILMGQKRVRDGRKAADKRWHSDAQKPGGGA